MSLNKGTYSYTDYRVFLKDSVSELLKEKSWSYRELSRVAGLGAPNFIQQVIAGNRNLKLHHVGALAPLFNLDSEEESYFRNLVEFDQAKNHQQKQKIYLLLRSKRKRAKVKILEDDTFDFFSRWYYPVVWELICHPHYKDSDWALSHIVPRITKRQLKAAQKSLMNLGLVQFNSSGKFIRTMTSVRTTPQVRSHAVMNYHKDQLQLAELALENTEAKNRDFRSVMLGLSESQLEVCKTKLQEFWKNLVEEIDESEEVEKIVQINFQLFPVSNKLSSSIDSRQDL